MFFRVFVELRRGQHWNEAAIIPFYIRGNCIIIFALSSLSVCFFIASSTRNKNPTNEALPTVRVLLGEERREAEVREPGPQRAVRCRVAEDVLRLDVEVDLCFLSLLF